MAYLRTAGTIRVWFDGLPNSIAPHDNWSARRALRVCVSACVRLCVCMVCVCVVVCVWLCVCVCMRGWLVVRVCVYIDVVRAVPAQPRHCVCACVCVLCIYVDVRVCLLCVCVCCVFLLFVCCLFVVCCLLFVVCCLLFVVCLFVCGLFVCFWARPGRYGRGGASPSRPNPYSRAPLE